MSKNVKSKAVSPYNVKAVLQRIETLETTGVTLYQEVQKIAVEALDHASYHHDFTLATRLVKAVEAFKGSRPKALKMWFKTFGPMIWSKQEDGTEGFKRAEDKTAYKVASATKTPYWDLNPEKDPVEVDVKKILGYLKSIAAKANGTAKGSIVKEGQEAHMRAFADFINGQAIPFVETLSKTPMVIEALETLDEEDQPMEGSDFIEVEGHDDEIAA